MNDDAIQAAYELAGQFDRLGVPYLIGGSMASAVWGEPRFTLDVDFVAALRNGHVQPLLAALGEAWYADADSIREAIEQRASFNLIRLERMVKVDVFVPPEGGLHASKWGRARREVLDPESAQTVAVTSAEDILLQKLDWYRSGGCASETQWRDVTSLLRIQGAHLDDEYLNHWASEMELPELLARARDEAQQ